MIIFELHNYNSHYMHYIEVTFAVTYKLHTALHGLLNMFLHGSLHDQLHHHDWVMKRIFSRRYVTFLTAAKTLLFGALLMPIILA